MGFLDLDADTSNIPEKIPQGFFRKEKPPEGLFPALKWHLKRRLLLAVSIVSLPVVILITYWLVATLVLPPAGAGNEKPATVTPGVRETDLIQFPAKTNNPSTDPEFTAPPPRLKPVSQPTPTRPTSGNED